MREYFKGSQELDKYDLSWVVISGKSIDKIIQDLKILFNINIKQSDKFLLMMYLEDKYNIHFKEYKTYKVL